MGQRLILTQVFFGLLLFSLGLLLCLLFLNLDPFSDEGSVFTISRGIADGKVLYRDFFNEKAPLQYILTAVAIYLTSDCMVVVRAVPAISLALVCVLSYALMLRAKAGLFASGSTALLLLLMGIFLKAFNNTAETSLALLFTLVIFIHGPNDKPKAFVTGLLMGLAAGFKLTALVPAGVLLLTPLIRGPIFAYLAGLFTGSLVWIIGLLLWGNLIDFYHAGIIFHVGNHNLNSYIRPPYYQDYGVLGLCLLFAIRPIWVFQKKPLVKELLLLALAAALPTLTRIDLFRLWPAFIMLFMSNVILLQDRWKPLVVTLPLTFLMLLVMLLMPYYKMTASMTSYASLIQAVRRHTQPDDLIWVGPYDPVIYGLTQRTPASRYYFILPWTAKPEVVSELLADLKTKQPVLMIVANHKSPLPLNRLLPGIDEFLADRYLLRMRIKGTLIYISKKRNSDLMSIQGVEQFQ